MDEAEKLTQTKQTVRKLTKLKIVCKLNILIIQHGKSDLDRLPTFNYLQ